MTAAFWLRLGLLGDALLLLEHLCRTGAIARRTMIPPSEMAEAMVTLIASGKVTGDIARTLACVAAAFVLAIVLGFAMGLGIHALPRLRRALDPFFATYYAVPFFIFYPVMIALFDLSMAPIVAMGFAFAVVAVVIATLNGLDRVPRVLGKVARVHGLSRLDAALKLKLPAAAPHLFAGVKLAVAYSFIGVVASEFIMAAAGLGHAIAYAYNDFDNRTMYGLMLFVLTLVTAVNMALYVWERRLAARRGGR
jgi:NitT/TauT family transport system permease protein